MDTDQAHYLRYNEARDGPQMRLQLEFEPDGHAVVLLNDSSAAQFARTLDIKGKFVDAMVSDVRCLDLDLQLGSAPPREVHSEYPLSSFVLATNGSSLMIPLADIKGDTDWAVAGLVITGKQYLRRPVVRSFMLPKDQPTEFVPDKFGDTWNDSFYKEPRIIESSPDTVFGAIESVMAIAKTLFAAQDYENSAKKYRKAFHYGHSYFPEELKAPNLAKLADLKITALLNLALCYLKLGKNSEVVSTADYALEIPEVSSLQRAKAYLRKATALANLQDEEQALALLVEAQRLNPDKAISAEIERCKDLRQQRKSAVSEALKGAFR